MNNVQMELRKCCNHPLLINGVKQKLREDLHIETTLEMIEEGKDAWLKSHRAYCAGLLTYLMELPQGFGFFNVPVDPVALNLAGYTEIVTEPMDLGTVSAKLSGGDYDKPEAQIVGFTRDVRLVFENALKFNTDPKHEVHQAANKVSFAFEDGFEDILSGGTGLPIADDDADKKKKPGWAPAPTASASAAAPAAAASSAAAAASAAAPVAQAGTGPSLNLNQRVDDKYQMKSMVAISGKMVLLDKLLPKLAREGHKVLIFSQFVMMLNLLWDYCLYVKE